MGDSKPVLGEYQPCHLLVATRVSHHTTACLRSEEEFRRALSTSHEGDVFRHFPRRHQTRENRRPSVWGMLMEGVCVKMESCIGGPNRSGDWHSLLYPGTITMMCQQVPCPYRHPDPNVLSPVEIGLDRKTGL